MIWELFDLKKERIAAGLSGFGLAKKLNVHFNTITSWEHKRVRPRPHNIEKISRLFKVDCKFDHNRLCDLIMNTGLTLSAFAKALGVSKRTVFNWCTKTTPTTDNLGKLSEYFGVESKSFFCRR